MTLEGRQTRGYAAGQLATMSPIIDLIKSAAAFRGGNSFTGLQIIHPHPALSMTATAYSADSRISLSLIFHSPRVISYNSS